ncbi:unnamed protein product [Tetraodon nigroviridis]|uniref:(spotted green pufferfish) hypothetical protein n=1 Tax=Tetraodon nigroviridis TaxID=99883 RepID=Q4SZC9_TETNG|nr:unnamed protein product [Tetraodon nigroviridis]
MAFMSLWMVFRLSCVTEITFIHTADFTSYIGGMPCDLLKPQSDEL